MSDKVRTAFATQARFCRQSGSAFTGDLLDALIAVIGRSTRTGARILDWPGDPMIDALKLRIAGGLHALARSGDDAELTTLYRTGGGDAKQLLARVLGAYDDQLYTWLDSAPQTNEVARSGALWPGLLTVARRFGPRLEILELGASAGLNLNMDRFAYDLGGTLSGDAASPVRIAPAWRDRPPPAAQVEIVARAGVDLNPLDVGDPAIAERLLAYVWPDQHERLARAEAAIAIARSYPPPVERGEGAAWIEGKLATPQPKGVTRVVYHSIALQYFPPEARTRVTAAIEAAGASATSARPLAWLSYEFPREAPKADLTLRCWPGSGEPQLLGHAHPHAAWVEWLAA